ncbi:expressed unknown protein [Seminavis robusta]|uniref:Uncharacterized protein n=1 Tax=Seminavis robusta TaxID=568900 RepID=A0A9N8E1T2_9STRA|nr:expressed unknown protein [Seminavis robusta]|eukprot:Sro562_g167130.1 n/a (282) ;mRNA; f:53670-54515
MMTIQKLALLALALVGTVNAQGDADPTGELAIEGLLDGNASLPEFPDFPCEAESVALETCINTNNCNQTCADLLSDDEMATDAPAEDPLDGMDPTDLDGIKMQISQAWTDSCNENKQEACDLKACCAPCAVEIDTTLGCLTTAFIVPIKDGVSQLLSSAGDIVGGLLDAANNLAGDVLNTTLAPTTGAGAAATEGGLGDFFDSLVCDYSNNPCDGSMPPPDTPGDGPAPADGSTPVPAPADGAAPAPAPAGDATEAPASGATSLIEGVTTLFAAVVGMMLI